MSRISSTNGEIWKFEKKKTHIDKNSKKKWRGCGEHLPIKAQTCELVQQHETAIHPIEATENEFEANWSVLLIEFACGALR